MFRGESYSGRTKTTDARGGVLTLMYDALDHRTGLIDPAGNRTTFVFDELNRQSKEIDPLNKTLTYVYDANDRLTQTVDRTGRKREYTYDDAGRMTGEVWKSAADATLDTLTFTYDNVGNLLTAADGDGTYTLTFDNLNRISTVKGLYSTTFTFTYDAVGNRTKIQDSFNGVTTSVYDELNRITRRQFGGVSQTTLTWDTSYTSRNQIDTVLRYSDLAASNKIGETNHTYDSVGRIENLKHKNGAGSILANYTHTYDLNSRVETEKLNGANPTTYVYDDTNQLTDDAVRSYSYDLNGNRTMTGYATGSANRMSNDGVYTYTYDDEGNLTKKSKGASAETWTYTYDNRNQMVGVTERSTDGGGTLLFQATYTYDVFNNRVKAEEYVNGSGTTTTKSAYADQGTVFADLDNANAMQTRYLRQDDSQYSPVVARIDSGGNAAWLYGDLRGSTRNVVNGSGTLIGTVAYDGFGAIMSESDSTKTGRFTFTGLTYQRTAQQLEANHRFYDPVVGRWRQEDAIRWSGGDVSLSRYVGNGPTNYADLSGLAPGLGIPWAGWDPADTWLHELRLEDRQRWWTVQRLGYVLVTDDSGNTRPD